MKDVNWTVDSVRNFVDDVLGGNGDFKSYEGEDLLFVNNNIKGEL
jgi:hypothetical protein